MSVTAIFVEESAADQLLSGLFFLVVGLLIAPYLAAWVVAVAEKLNGVIGPLGDSRIRFFAFGRHFFAFSAAAAAALGAARLSVFMAVKSGLMQAPWSGPA